MTLRLFHTGDFHLDSGWGFLNSPLAQKKREREREEALDWLAQKALDSGVDLLFLAGDQFDNSHPSRSARRSFLSFLEKLSQGEIEVVMISGNHDMMGLPGGVYEDFPTFPHFHFLSQPNWGEPLEMNIRGERLFIYGFSYHPGQSPSDCLEKLRKVDQKGYHLALIHGSLQTSGHFYVDTHYVPLKGDQLAQTGMDYIALGHYHRLSIHHMEKGICAYPGTPVGLGYKDSESGPRHYLEVELAEGKKPGVKKREFAYPTRRWIEKETLSLTGGEWENSRDLEDWIREKWGDPNRILQLELAGMPSFSISNLEKMEERLRGDFFDLRLQANLDFVDSKQIQNLLRENTIRGRTFRRIRALIESEEGPDEKVGEMALQYLWKYLVK